jgi:hypothetical protein
LGSSAQGRSAIRGPDLEQLPLTRYAPEGRFAQRVEREVRARRQVADRSRDDDLATLSGTQQARRDVDGDPADARLAALDLAGVDAGADRGKPSRLELLLSSLDCGS